MGESLRADCGQNCAACGGDFAYADEAYQVQIVTISLTQDAQGVQMLNFSELTDDDGEYLFFPYFIEIDCWKKDMDTLREQIEDEETYAFVGAITTCTFCGSSIMHGEKVCIANQVRFKVSERDPDSGQHTDLDIPTQRPDIMCACCLYELNQNITTYWDEGDFLKEARQRETWAQNAKAAS